MGTGRAILIYREVNERGVDANKVSMKIVDVPAGKEYLSGMQAAVEGYVERVDTVRFPSKRRAEIYVNEEGAINGKWDTPTVIYQWSHGQTQALFGPVLVICGSGKHKAGGLGLEDMENICLVRDIDTLPTDADIPLFRIRKQPRS